MIPQTDKSWCDCRALNQNWSYQPTLAGRAVLQISLIEVNVMTFPSFLGSQEDFLFHIFAKYYGYLFNLWIDISQTCMKSPRYYVVQTLECTLIQGSDKVAMVIC